MLGMFHLLPFLKGWEYKSHILTRTVRRGAAPIEVGINEAGWLMSMGVLTDDCYGTVWIDWQGADLQTRSGGGNPESFLLVGAVSQDPAGWLQRYFRPNPASTAGIFALVPFTGGYQGSTFPYVPTVKMKVSLMSDSTQETATVSFRAETIAITDKRAFLASLRKIFGITGKIDPLLLVTGPVELKEEA